MIIRERPEIASELLLRAQSHKPKRSPGFHATDHTKCLRKTIFSIITDRDLMGADEGTQLMLLRGEGLGMFFAENQEEWRFYAKGFGYCSIDRPWQDDAGNKIPMELKSTRMSAAYPIIDEEAATIGYVAQVITYLTKALKKDYMDRSVDFDTLPDANNYSCVLYVLYEMGDWTERKPDHRAFELILTGAEVKQWDKELQRRHKLLVDSATAILELEEKDPNFAMQLERLRDYLPAYYDLEPYLPPVEEHYKWECKQYSICPLVELIGCEGNSKNAAWGKPPFEIEEHYVREHRERKRKK